MALRAWIVVAVLSGCSGDGGGGATDGDTDTDAQPASGDCSDPAVNPWAGTCVETFLADCFDPAGECTGQFDMMGDGSLEWANGANIVITTDLTNPMSPVVINDLTASDGTLCAVGRTETMVGVCFSQTTYQRQSDGAQQVWCVHSDGALDVTCDNGTTISVDAADSQAGSDCQYGSDAEACEVETPQM